MDQPRADGSMDCPFDRLPLDIIFDILSRLSVSELSTALESYVAWQRIVLTSKIFQRLYDHRNKELWIVLTSDQHSPGLDLCFFNNNSNVSYFFETKCWLLQGAADGLLLLVANDGKLLVGNPLARRFRLLPDTQVSPRLRLESCMKKKLWENDSTPTPTYVQPSISINMVVDEGEGGKTFKVMVWGELRRNQVHALVYSSATDKWTVTLCTNSDIKHTLFSSRFHTTVEGNTIFYSSMQRQRRQCVLAKYDTQTGFFSVNRLVLQVWRRRQWLLGFRMERNEYIKMIVSSGHIYLLSVMIGRQMNINPSQSCGFMGLWRQIPPRGYMSF